MKFAIAQTAPESDTEESLKKGITLISEAGAEGADLILFPEMYNTGYIFDENFLTKAVTTQSRYINKFREAAALEGIAVGITFLEKRNQDYYNSALLIDMNGKDILHYSKVHTCSFSDEAVLTPGNEFKVAELKTKTDSVRTGFMICFDREFPESARVLMLKGAEIILVPNACEMEDNRVAQLRSRAFENMTGIILSNYAGEVNKGNSLVISPAAFDENGKSLNTLIFKGDEKENLFYAELDINDMRKYRKREVWGGAYRKPDAYKILTENISNEDFHK
jgi:predicted amidohydrolase